MRTPDWIWILLSLALFFAGVALIGWFVRDPSAAQAFVETLLGGR